MPSSSRSNHKVTTVAGEIEAMPSSSRSNHKVTTVAGEIKAHVFNPPDVAKGTIVTVHPWSALGGGEHNTTGFAQHVASKHGWRVVTFKLQSTYGGPLWGLCSSHSYEVQQVVDVVRWAARDFGGMLVSDKKSERGSDIDELKNFMYPLVLYGSSAGAPIAGSAMARLQTEGMGVDTANVKVVSAYIALGYTFGNVAALGFGRHFSSILGRTSAFSFSRVPTTYGHTVPPPKYFIMGQTDQFTTPELLKKMVEEMKHNGEIEGGSCRVDMKIVPKLNHFDLENPKYDGMVARIVMKWVTTLNL